MFKKLFVFMLFTAALFAYGDTYYNDLDEIKGEKTFVLVEEDYCPWCKRFKQNVLTDKTVIEALAGYKIAVLMKDRWNKEGLSHVRLVPTMFFLDTNKKILLRQDGFVDKKEFLQLIQSLQKDDRW
jgi:thioredoxin-related protein